MEEEYEEQQEVEQENLQAVNNNYFINNLIDRNANC